MDETWSKTPDAVIIDACLEGNEKAWQALVNRYKRLVYSIPLKWGLSPEDTVDIFQSVWLDCFRQLSTLRNMERLQPWLIRVAIRKCHRFTSDTRSRGETAVPDNEMEELSGYEDVATLFDLDREQLVRSALDKLTPRCRRGHPLSVLRRPTSQLPGHRLPIGLVREFDRVYARALPE
jgi:RNA polymerase sigma factor (sigma-70 family)